MTSKDRYIIGQMFGLVMRALFLILMLLNPTTVCEASEELDNLLRETEALFKETLTWL